MVWLSAPLQTLAKCTMVPRSSKVRGAMSKAATLALNTNLDGGSSLTLEIYLKKTLFARESLGERCVGFPDALLASTGNQSIEDGHNTTFLKNRR